MKQKHWFFQRNYTSKIVHFGVLIHILSWNIHFRLLRKIHELKINKYLIGIIDVTLFDGVEGLD